MPTTRNKLSSFFSIAMASPYFSHLPSPDDSDIDAIISEATDLCVLEQIAALNTAHLSDSLLPTDLESRFRKLKTFPGADHRPQNPSHCSVQEKENIPTSSIQSENFEESGESKSEIISTASPKPERLKDYKKELRDEVGASPSVERRSPSPTRVICCFGCSPKKMVQRRKGKQCEEIFLDFGVSSMKEQRRKLEKVLKEQERASREVEKMVEVMEEAAARMNAEALDELMSGDGDIEFK
ncbi:uncharacterized protein LOC110099612 [Dendrobium catenatum]|uniref:Uncharacterized protein n=1 Tax=Dendrobium catenatum TaxID=906689 RepID=A0A2I0VI28_9ASPA|nr:uncharacterized protein LOC110099612 [Dendrobium catenatum]PKU63075.1 hypothetical protein MA16_Dca024904 [Dendrobium catenatum]